MPNSISETAVQKYLNSGFTLFPLVGKIPPKGFKWGEAVYEPFMTFKGNYGVKLCDDDLVIDIDPRNFPKGKNPLEDFQTAIQFRLKDSTFAVKTGGGGIHLYFKKPRGFATRGLIKEYFGIEFKSKGNYVVGAGSIHPDTKKEYTILYDRPIAQVPQTLLELLKKIPLETPAGIIEYTDDQQTRERFIQYLKTAPVAVEGENGDHTTFTVSAVAHDLGLHPDTAFELMLDYYNPDCLPPWTPEQLRQKVYNAYKYAANPIGSASVIDKFDEIMPAPGETSLRVDTYGRIIKNVYNTVVVFNVDMPDMLSLNLFSEDITFLKPAPWHRPNEIVKFWNDEETARCKYFMGRERRYEPPTQNIEDAIVNVARQKPFHPIKNYLEGLKWDGHERLKNWLTTYCGVADNEYSRAVGLKMLVAAVTRIYYPGHKFDYIPVLEGAQGVGKSRTVAVLGGDWYGDITIDVHAKDTVDIMRRLWIIEVSEMETQYRTETQALKSFLSRNTDICRLAYGRRSKIFPRQNIFIGTINPEEDEDTGWLKDTTGNRRFWTVFCTKIDIEALKKVRDQLWAEALIYQRQHTLLHFDDLRIEEAARAEQIKRMGIDPWFDQVANWLDNEVNRDKNMFSSSEVFTDCLMGRATQFNRGCQTRIALIMKKLGWVKGVYMGDHGKAVRGYKRPEEVE